MNNTSASYNYYNNSPHHHPYHQTTVTPSIMNSPSATPAPAPAPPPPPSTDLPKIPPTLQGSLHLPTATAAQLVVFYSQVYAYWDAQVKSCKDSGDTTSATYQWAAYYSDLSSRAAHHYNAIKDMSPWSSSSLGAGGIFSNSSSTALSTGTCTGNFGTTAHSNGTNSSMLPPPRRLRFRVHRPLLLLLL
jgi:hypothetical protein